MTFLGAILAIAVGTLMGLLGGGGSVLTIPIFVYILEFPAKSSIAMSLIVVAITSLFGAMKHWYHGNIDISVALIFGSFAMSGSFLSARWLSPLFSGPSQLILFAVILWIMAILMLIGKEKRESQQLMPRLSIKSMAIQGIAVGILSGLIGVSGGFIVVPALVLLAKMPASKAIGTAMLIAAMNASSGFIGYLGQVKLQWQFIIGFSLAALLGIFAGTHIVNFLPDKTLKRIFCYCLFAVSAFVIYQNRHVF